MRHRFSSLAVLAGIALALLAPARPAAADDSCAAGYDCVDCSQVIVFDPSFCMYGPPPDDTPPPPPPPGPSDPGRGPMQEMPSTPPGMNPDQAGEVCSRELNFRDPAFIVQRGQPDKRIYTFTLRVNFCTRNGIVTKASVIPGLELEPFDARVMSVTRPAIFLGPNGQGTPTFTQAQDVLTEFCPDLVNCVTYRHTIDVTISAGPPPSVNIVPDLFLCPTC